MLYSKKFLRILFLSNLLFLLSDCQLKVPLTYFPLYINKYSSPSDIMEYFVYQNAYANLEVGHPKQSIQIPLKFETNDFYIVDYDIFTEKDNYFSGYKLYNSSESNTHEEVDWNFKDGDYFQMARLDKDIFYFNNKNYSLEFYYPYGYSEGDSGGIGILLDPLSDHEATKDRKLSFFGKLKNSKLIENYYWSIFYNSKENKKEDESFILLGKLPHEINSDLGYYKRDFFKENYIKNFYINKNLEKLEFKIDLLYGYNGTNKDKIIEGFPSGVTNYKELILNYHSGAVKIPASLQIYYHKIFEEYILKGQCFNETFKQKNIFYYCKNDKNVIKKIKNVFPGINFRSQDLVYNFTLEANDFLLEENNLVFFLMYFEKDSSEKKWIMGKPFLKKYQFSFNYDKNTLFFYNKIDESKSKKYISVVIFILTIVATIIVVAIICFIIFKFFLYERFFRKKRANELEDNDYEFSSKKDKEDALNINN